jgi:matrixin/fibronectin type III domain protein
MSLTKFMGFFLLFLWAMAASATTYVGMSDESLVDQAAVVARGKVIDGAPGTISGAPATSYLVEVEAVAKGYVPGSAIEVRVPGGVGADGVGLRIWGAPEFQPGDEPLLFLNPAPDGSFRIVQLMLGAFHARRSGGHLFAVQDLSQAHRMGPEPEDPARVRDREHFESWIADRAAGIQRAADYWRPAPAGLEGPREKYAQIQGDDGLPVRWFKFDGGGSVAWKLDAAGQPGLDPSQAQERFQAAIQAWNGDPTSTIQYTYAGLMSAGSGKGLHSTDGINGVLFNDPGNDVAGSFDCRNGGILALSGPYFIANSTRGYRGQAYHEIVEADVVFQDGTQCFFQNDPSGLEEVMAHELGHTLGFAHSADRDALMWAGAHNDGRGARLADDDRLAASVVYGDGSFQPSPPPPPPSALKLKASASRANVLLTWTNAPGGTVEFHIESQQGKDSFQLMETTPGDLTAVTLSGLAANRTYSLRVVAMGADGVVGGISNVVKVRTKK